MTARTVNLSQRQLTQLDAFPQNCMLRWKAFGFPSQDERSVEYGTVHLLLGSARFRVSLPDHVRTLRIVVHGTNVSSFLFGALTESAWFPVCSFIARSASTSRSQ